jgi:hypothetical protein
MARIDSILGRLVSGEVPLLGLLLVALGMLAGSALGIPPAVLVLAGGLGALLVTGLLLTPYCLLLVGVSLAFAVWSGMVLLPI